MATLPPPRGIADFFFKYFLIYSPSEGPCCSDKCELTNEIECDHETECRFAVKCDGKESGCPIPLHKSDASPCDGGSKVCIL